LTGALCVLLSTGIVMVVGEPVRELMAFSFWLKMFLVAVGTLIAALFQIALRRNAAYWETSLSKQVGTKSLALFTLFIWIAIVVLGRLIAYDHVWGSWSHAPKL
jgi:hypothetical protein